MQTTNALEVRRSLGKVLLRLSRGGEPIIVERNGVPAAVLVSISDFRERFADVEAADERKKLVEEILAMRKRARPSKRTAVEEIRALRGALP
jgi:prevent-host-death family protein